MFMLPRRRKAFSQELVPGELPEAAIKTDKSPGSFDYAPSSIEVNMVFGGAPLRKREGYAIANIEIVAPRNSHSLFPISSPSIESR